MHPKFKERNHTTIINAVEELSLKVYSHTTKGVVIDHDQLLTTETGLPMAFNLTFDENNKVELVTISVPSIEAIVTNRRLSLVAFLSSIQDVVYAAVRRPARSELVNQ